jgi:TorA maturation chaperone TorD
MSALAEKLAYAAQADDLEESEICVAAQRKFLRCHLGCWLPAFTQRLIDDGPGFHHVAAGFTALFIEAECRRLDVPHGSPYLQLRRVDQENESAQACGKEVCGVPAAPFTPLTIGQT